MHFKRTLTLLFLAIACQTFYAQNNYFFPPGTEFDPDIKSPAQFLGYSIGDWHTRIDRMAAYMEYLADQSPNASYQVIGYTYEMRPQVILTITSPENLSELEEIRKIHLDSANPDLPAGDFESMPAIIHLGYNVHGNEPSSTEAAMLTAYYFAASHDEFVEEALQNAVIFIEPALNPDGRDRHSSWVNHHKAQQLVADPLDGEHNEGWPRGRTNHYWFDLNRDWLPLAQVESRNRVRFFHKWLPNVVTDYHEMGPNSTYFFEPTKPYGSENPVVPRSNYDDLNPLFAEYFREALDEIGSLYWTKEAYDNSYPGYGSTYPDIHGGLGLVFEQASSRGHLQTTPTGEISFAFTIRNHLRTSIATVKAGVENRIHLNEHQRRFFTDAKRAGGENEVKAYVFGDSLDQNRNMYFLELLLRHQIKVFQLSDDIAIGNMIYKPGKAFVVPSQQSQFLMVRTVFENVTTFADSVFYDASAWSIALAFGMPFSELGGMRVPMGPKITLEAIDAEIHQVKKAPYAYIMSWQDYNSPAALYHLLKNKVNAKVAFKPFEVSTTEGNIKFDYGSIMIPVADQQLSPNELFELVQEASSTNEVKFASVSTGMNVSGIDLGSRNFVPVNRPKALMLIGDGTSAYETGEIWHLLDTRVKMPITKLDISDFNRVNLDDYTVLILSSGNYNSLNKNKINDWLRSGGTLIAQRTACNWVVRNELVSEKLLPERGDEKAKQKDENPVRIDYVQARDYLGAKAIGGSFYEIDLDNTNPIGFGYSSRSITVYKNSTVFLKPSSNPFATVGIYTDEPWISGYVHPENLEKIKNSAAILTLDAGRGRVILFTDNMNFRGMMYGTNKLFLNALFFGPLINVPNG